MHFSYDSSGRGGGRGGGGGDGGAQYTVVRRPDVLVQATHHVLDSGETIVIGPGGNLASTPLSSHHNIDDGQVKTCFSFLFFCSEGGKRYRGLSLSKTVWIYLHSGVRDGLEDRRKGDACPS